ncbi:MAG: hypothetical protein IJ501_00450 [Bacilli bacterium]|nr:hypothetical protein [Bacilli bacterium]
MSRNSGKFIGREVNKYPNGDKAVTDTFMLYDGTLVYHVYNVTAGGREHSHQIMDEHGRHIYARAIGGDHPWIELDRMVALRWLESLTPEKMEKLMKVTDMNTLELIMNIAYSDPVEENTFEKRMSL